MGGVLEGKNAVVFDLDGTLVFTPQEVLIKRIRETLDLAKLTQQTEERIIDFYRHHDWDNTLVKKWGFNEEQCKHFWKTYIEYVEDYEQDETQIHADAIPTLSVLRGRGLKISIVTSATQKYLQRQTRKIGQHYFDYCLCVGNHTFLAPKPFPSGINYILDCAGCFKNEIASVGDSDLDIQMARNAGCLDILIDRGVFQEKVQPSIKIKSLQELI